MQNADIGGINQPGVPYPVIDDEISCQGSDRHRNTVMTEIPDREQQYDDQRIVDQVTNERTVHPIYKNREQEHQRNADEARTDDHAEFVVLRMRIIFSHLFRHEVIDGAFKYHYYQDT